MTINFGKRNPGLLTAASPGDTLYIPLAFFNDSGASISIGSSLAVTDIEVFRNGSISQRLTDSGYAILGDTGNFDSRVGFKGISISLFNTADDASFYAVGSSYWVGIDSVTVDGRTVRFWPAVFEIGEPRANIVQIAGDTGAANYLKNTFAAGFADTGLNERLGRIQSDVDTGLRTHINDLDTGLHDTLADYDTGVRALLALQDTGAVANAVWGFATRGITAISDTGLNDNLGRIRSDVDTGLRVHIDDLDTGLHAHISDVDTGVHSILQTTGVLVAAFSDTGVNDRLARILADTDTGLKTVPAAIKAKTDSLTFTVAGVVDANIQRVNDVNITGTGDTGTNDTWRPA